MQDYFDQNTGGFNEAFRRSNLLTQIDATDDSILSSRADVTMQYRLVPVTNVSGYSIYYPSAISAPLEDTYVIRSDTFSFNGKVCFLRNKLNTTKIEVVEVATADVIVDSVGDYDASNGTITLVGFTGSVITGSYIKINATPANPSVLNPTRNNIIRYDAESSNARAVLTDTL
jgi:hypothetical protein